MAVERKAKKKKAVDEDENYWFGSAPLKKRKRKDYGKCIFSQRGCKIDPNCSGGMGECEEYESIQPFIPRIDENYSLNLEICEAVAFALDKRDNVLLAGPPGCGKSSLVMMIAAITDWELIRFSCSEETRQSQVIGQWLVVGDKMVWSDGYATDALRNGKILLEDEADFMRPELRGALHPLLETDGTLTLQNYHPQTGKPFMEVIPRNPDFRWVSTANTTGLGDDSFMYHGTQFMNAAARDRYHIIVPMNYLSIDEETEIICAKTPKKENDAPGIEEETARNMSRVAHAIREVYGQQKIQYQFSMRRLLSWAKYHSFYGDRKPSEAVRLAVTSFARDDDIDKLLEIIRLHFGAEFTEGISKPFRAGGAL